MPQRVYCKDEECKAILYEGPELESPADIAIMYDDHCPKCGRRFDFNPEKVKPIPFQEETPVGSYFAPPKGTDPKEFRIYNPPADSNTGAMQKNLEKK